MENIKFIRTLENLIDIKLLYKNIYLYGAGVRLNYFLEMVKEQNIKLDIKSIIVTSKSGNPENISGIPVIDVDEYHIDKDDVVLLKYQNFILMKSCFIRV